jgi:hypothetical protein
LGTGVPAGVAVTTVGVASRRTAGCPVGGKETTGAAEGAIAGTGVFCVAGACVGAVGAGVVGKVGGNRLGAVVCGPAQPDRKKAASTRRLAAVHTISLRIRDCCVMNPFLICGLMVALTLLCAT